MIDLSGTYTDHYQITMGQVYFLHGKQEEKAVYDYFFRKLPYDGGFAVFAGLETFLRLLEELRFSDEDLAYLKQLKLHPEYLEYLRNFRFTGKVYAVREGEIVFPGAPIVRIESNLIEAQLIETLLLNTLNFQTLIATKASRMKLQAGERKLLDFGLRRAQGLGGYHASRAAIIGGFEATSNTRAGRDFGLKVAGTMAHSFIQSYDNELDAFMDFACAHPDNTVLLVDTYDTLRSGVPNAIKVAREMKKKGHQLKGIRLDSGDLAYLAIQARKMLDQEGLQEVQIAVSNQLDEYLIRSLLDQDAPIDVFGVGTSLVTGKPDAALDGVYKLAFSQGQPRIKLSETIAKVTLPHRKEVFRILDEEENFAGADVVTLAGEEQVPMMYHPFDPLKFTSVEGRKKERLFHCYMDQGRICEQLPVVSTIASYSQERLGRLPQEYKRFFNPHQYKVGISGSLRDERDKLINQHKNMFR